MNADNLLMKSLQSSVVSKCELINSFFHEQSIDVGESGNKFALKE